ATRRSGSRAHPAHLERPVLNLLVQNHQGYQNLCSLLTQAHTGLPKGEAALDLEMLQGAHLSITAALPVQTGPQKAALEPWLRHLSELFTGRGYIGCFRRFDG